MLKNDSEAKSRFTQKECSDTLTRSAIGQEQEVVPFAAIYLKSQIEVFVYKHFEYEVKWSDCAENHFHSAAITVHLQSLKM